MRCWRPCGGGALLALAACVLAASAPPAPPAPPAPIYHDQFAVHVPAGERSARALADKHGFLFHGQIGSLGGYFLLSHRGVQRRSLRPSLKHHTLLRREPQVRWLEQQRERIRTKRDYTSVAPDSAGDDTRSQLTRRPPPPPPPPPSHRGRHRAPPPAPYFPDPLFKDQWYLNGAISEGLDMNVGSAWQKGYTGKGVVVSILDDGIQTNHPDLIQNYDPVASSDINGNDSDPTPQDNGDNKHGTRCAGEVAAVAYNQYCGVGVAYNASVGGVRMLDGVVNDAVEARALGFNPDHIDIYSASWGPEDDGKTVDGPGPLARRAFIYGVTNGRKGKGSIFVWASGNGGRHTDSCNCDGYTNSIFTLSISSATQGGYKPWYLEECSSTLASTFSSGTPGRDKSVATVDMDGRLRPDHICTAEHTGTSASAPLAAGICALALEANPELTWRDMQYLVVLTSRSRPLEKEAGWMLNGVKRKVSHKFGYGLMDAAEMVTLAEQWTTVPPQHICKSQEINEDKRIEVTYGYTMTVHMDVNGCSGTVNEVRFLEHVQCKISLRFFPRGNLRIILTSPMGTTSTLLFERPRDIVSSNFDDWPFLSVHFWGERAEGRWNLQINNAGNHNVKQPGILRKWQLIFHGTSIDPVRLRSKRPSQYNSPEVSQSIQRSNDLPNSYISDAYESYHQRISDLPVSFESHNIPSAQRENVLADVNDKRVQHMCDRECDSQGCYGRGPTQCIACKHYRLDNTCVSRCPPRSFANQGGVCWPCHESCETCAGPGQDSCLTCAPMLLLAADLAVCLQQCPEGYYESPDESSCSPCAPNCASCSERADACLSCEHQLVLHDGSCYSTCPQGTYETAEHACQACHITCETCNGSSDSECVSCRAGHYSLNGTCLKQCPATYYGDKKRRECIKCPVGCASCRGTSCLDCEENWSLNKKKECVPEGSDRCDTSEYFTSGRCRRCHSTCDACSGATERHCLSCQPPLLLQQSRCVASCERGYYEEAARCALCPHACAACVSRLNCTSCAGALRLQSGSCRTTCAAGYYADRGACAKCYLSCRTCSGGRRDQCASCPPGWQLAGGECHPECPEGYFRSTVGCQKCHHYCRNCKGSGPLQCTSCPAHFMLQGGLCTECLGSQYYDVPAQACAACHESCRSCSGPGAFSCVACATPLHLDRLTNQCVPCCAGSAPSPAAAAGNVSTLAPAPTDCCRCDKETGGCENSSPAGKRRIAEAEPYVASGDRSVERSADRSGEARDDGGAGAGWLAAAAGAAALVLLAASFVTQVRSFNSRSARRNSGYSRLACSDTEHAALALASTALSARRAATAASDRPAAATAAGDRPAAATVAVATSRAVERRPTARHDDSRVLEAVT